MPRLLADLLVRRRRWIVLLSLGLLAACGRSEPDPALATPEELARREAPAVLPAGGDTSRRMVAGGGEPSFPAPVEVPVLDERPARAPAVVPAPVRRRPPVRRSRVRDTIAAGELSSNPPAPGLARTGLIAEGATLRFASERRVCSGAQGVGDQFTARLIGAVEGTNGLVLPSGALGTFEVASAKRANNQRDDTFLRVRLVSVLVEGTSYSVRASTDEMATVRTRSASTGTDAQKIAGGAILGGIAGQILGKNTKGTVIGAAAGAAAGTAAAMATADYNTCLPIGASLTVTLSEPLALPRRP